MIAALIVSGTVLTWVGIWSLIRWPARKVVNND